MQVDLGARKARMLLPARLRLPARRACPRWRLLAAAAAASCYENGAFRKTAATALPGAAALARH